MAPERQEQTMHFPAAGIDVSAAFDRQPVRDLGGVYAYTTPVGVNVKTFDAFGDRARGGVRGGLVKYQADRAGGDRWVIQGLDVIVSTAAAARG